LVVVVAVAVVVVMMMVGWLVDWLLVGRLGVAVDSWRLWCWWGQFVTVPALVSVVPCWLRVLVALALVEVEAEVEVEVEEVQWRWWCCWLAGGWGVGCVV
jgi:hypothetical protein